MKYFFLLIPLLVFSIVLSGCYSQIAIAPNQLEYVNNDYNKSDVIRVRNKSGKLVNINKKEPIKVTFVNGKSYVFEYPYEFSLHKNAHTFRVYSKNHPDMYFSIASIRSVSIRTNSTAADTIYGFLYLLPFLPFIPIAVIFSIFSTPQSHHD
ncbi:hypothetical protein KKF34_13730 [Myxococcota bacterium]|nr:hypothetical protein [Myxococcota bacterium]MBU1379244.1 hypothetical protein [Myxococcota bacterium]MBU1497931.1 hypothetical protein [Myxococcota bacterium]